MENVNFTQVAILIGTISLGLIGVVMAGAALFPELAERYKRQIPTVIVGIIITAMAALILAKLGLGG